MWKFIFLIATTFLGACLTTATPAVAGDDDATAVALNNAKSEREAAIQDADSKLLDGLEKMVKDLEASGDSHAAKAVANAKDRFEKSHIVPHSAAIHVPVNEYLKNRQVADQKLAAAYDEAITAYTKQANDAEASATRSEKAKLIATEKSFRVSFDPAKPLPKPLPQAAKTAPANVPNKQVAESAFAMSQAYQANSIAADQKYKGKTFAVGGVIKQIGKTTDGGAFVRFESVGKYWPVVCYFTKAEGATNFVTGATAVISGDCDGDTPVADNLHIIAFANCAAIAFTKEDAFTNAILGK